MAYQAPVLALLLATSQPIGIHHARFPHTFCVVSDNRRIRWTSLQEAGDFRIMMYKPRSLVNASHLHLTTALRPIGIDHARLPNALRTDLDDWRVSRACLQKASDGRIVIYKSGSRIVAIHLC
jgi:hypothetical protein